MIEALQEIARSHGAEPSQVALAWLTQFHGSAVFAIPGASRRAQAVLNAGALELTLSPKELTALDQVLLRAAARRARPAAPSPRSATA